MSGLKIKHINLTSRSLTVKESDWTPWFDHEITFHEKYELWIPSSYIYLHLIVTFAISQHPVFKHPPWDRASPSSKTLVNQVTLKFYFIFFWDGRKTKRFWNEYETFPEFNLVFTRSSIEFWILTFSKALSVIFILQHWPTFQGRDMKIVKPYT
jgi:hypothetical protein